MEQVVPTKISSPEPNYLLAGLNSTYQSYDRFYKANGRLTWMVGFPQLLYRSIYPSGAGAEGEILPALARIRLLSPPLALFQRCWDMDFHSASASRTLCTDSIGRLSCMTKKTPSNSRPRQIQLILAFISAIMYKYSHTVQNYTFGDKLLRSWAFELDRLLVIL